MKKSLTSISLFSNQQIGRLGGTLGEREIKYLMLIPMNGDPIEFIPEVEQVSFKLRK